MILVKAPLRVSLFGGGTDVPDHFLTHGGTTLSFTIATSVYASLIKTPQPHIKMSYSTTETVENVTLLKHDIARCVLKDYGVYRNLEVASFADIPTVGTGLGASSAFAVALVLGMNYMYERNIDPSRTSPLRLASHAGYIERYDVGSPIGFQDHIAAAYGGVVYANYGCGNSGTTVETTPVSPSVSKHMILVKVPNRTTSANEILSQAADPSLLCRLRDHAIVGRVLLEQERYEEIGQLLHTAWGIKQRTRGGISTITINAMYEKARYLGAIGGKLLGAGGGGYLLLCVPGEETVRRIKNHFPETLDVVPTNKGAEVVYAD